MPIDQGSTTWPMSVSEMRYSPKVSRKGRRTRRDRRGEKQGKGGGDEWAHIGNEPHQHGEDALHDGNRHTD